MIRTDDLWVTGFHTKLDVGNMIPTPTFFRDIFSVHVFFLSVGRCAPTTHSTPLDTTLSITTLHVTNRHHRHTTIKGSPNKHQQQHTTTTTTTTATTTSTTTTHTIDCDEFLFAFLYSPVPTAQPSLYQCHPLLLLP